MPKNKSRIATTPKPESVDQSIDVSGKSAPLAVAEPSTVAQPASPPPAQQIDAAPVYQGAIAVAQNLNQDLIGLEQEVAAACVQRVQQSPSNVAALVNANLQGAGASPAQFRLDVSPRIESLRADMGLQQA